MKTSRYIMVVTTVGSLAEAQVLARLAVEQRLAACAQISAIESIYRWNGGIQNDAEWRVIFKSRAACFDALAAAIREAHPYELPALHAITLDHVDAAYGEWIDAHVLLPE